MKPHPSLLIMTALLVSPATGLAKEKSEYARELRTQLVEQVMPYWFDTAQDLQNGGYLMADDVKGRGTARDKQLVSQSRMVWGFSHFHLQRYGDAKRDYLKAAAQGYRFLLDHFLDQENGGYFWKTDLTGKPIVDRKYLYGESFVVYALVEYYRASGDQEALRHALELYRVVQKHCHDSKYGGWIEHSERDWQPILTQDNLIEVEVAGLRSANAHLHWMEALAELCEATRDPEVRKSLQEAVRINRTYFYPKDAGQSCFHRQPDWKEVKDPKSAGLSYGHNVEFAWLMIRAEEVLGQKPSWPHFHAHLSHALKYGYDHERGGLYSRGFDDQPATDTDKVWWVEAEMLAALTDALKHLEGPAGPGDRSAYDEALRKLLDFVLRFQVNPANGIWLDTVTADGKPKSTRLAHNWKANYHDVRALVKFINAFGR